MHFASTPFLVVSTLCAYGITIGQHAAVAQSAPPTTVGERYAAIDGEVQLMWRRFCDRLRADDAEGALAHFSVYARPRYTEAFHALGTQLHTLPDTWSELKLHNAFGIYAEYAVNSTFKDESRLHFVTFIKGADGLWYIESL